MVQRPAQRWRLVARYCHRNSAPFPHSSLNVRMTDDRARLIQFGYELEEQIPQGLAEQEVTDLVDNPQYRDGRIENPPVWPWPWSAVTVPGADRVTPENGLQTVNATALLLCRNINQKYLLNRILLKVIVNLAIKFNLFRK